MYKNNKKNLTTNVRSGGGQPLLSKGFTLIELLSVIVILAIISLIAIPIILEIIKDTTEKSNQRSIEMYAKAIENAISGEQLSGIEEVIGSFNASTIETKLTVEYNGEKIACDTIEIYKDGSIYLDKCKINNSEKEYTFGKDKSYNNGQIVYFDVVKGIGCTEEEYKLSYSETNKDYLNSGNGYNGITTRIDGRNSCLKFYAFNDNYGDKINLLLDHNTSPTVIWVSENDYYDKEKWKNNYWNSLGPITALKKLYEDTKEWNVPVITKSYTVNQTKQKSSANYTIEYSKVPEYEGVETPFKARLITVSEIASIVDNNSFDENNSSSEWFYFDVEKIDNNINWQKQNLSENLISEYGWLYDRTSTSCKESGCLNNSATPTHGYCTATANAASKQSAWFVNCTGNIKSDYVHGNSGRGVRPVIEVYKSSLK